MKKTYPKNFNVKCDEYIITSPNDWIRRAGTHVTNGVLELPHKFIHFPMMMASEAVEEYNKKNDLSSRIKSVLVIALCIRIVDTSVHRMLARHLNNIIKGGTIQICSTCVRDDIFNTNLTKLRHEVNDKIIHRMENGGLLDTKDFHVAIDYYDEIFKLPLVVPIHFKKQSLSLCKRCLKKNKQLRLQIKS